ncbi:hypothetical protein AALP_AA8G130600 [Arabis alpina]|uniref:Protein TIFY n=1 Tax=Arabis alpina TaxID=50452 RepID=A0A087G6Q8_ARAAL|nr:hypothetical protein AALP_AA8G130600 [Arabis alpina]
MSRATIELDFLGLDKKQQTNNNNNNMTPKPKFKKLLDRRRSFRDIQGAISKIDPEIIKSLLASGGKHSDSPSRSPSTPKQEQTQIPNSTVHEPLARPSTEIVTGTIPMTIFYNGSVSVFQVSRNKAENIMKVVMETASSKKEKAIMEKDLSVIPPTTLRPTKLFGQNLEGDLPIARRKSLQRFLEKRKERVVSTSPYFPMTLA